LSDDDRPVVKAIHTAWKKHYGKKGEIGVGLAWHSRAMAKPGGTTAKRPAIHRRSL